MRSSSTRDKHYLKCSNRHIAQNACIGSFISVDKLEQLVLLELNRLADKYLDKEQIKHNIKFHSDLQKQKSNLLSDMAVYEKKATEYSNGIRELYTDKVKGLISERDYIEISKNFNTERNRLERVISEMEKQLSGIEEKIATGNNHSELIEQYISLKHLTLEIVEILVDYIFIGKRISGTRNVHVEIHWNF